MTTTTTTIPASALATEIDALYGTLVVSMASVPAGYGLVQETTVSTATNTASAWT